MKKPGQFKVLLVYPNLYMMLVPPTSIALFTSIFKNAGYEVDLFDATHYINEHTASTFKRVKYLQARPFSPDDLGVKPKSEGMIDDFINKVDEFNPDFIVVSVVEDTFMQAVALLESIQDRNIPAIVGGVFITAAPDTAIKYPNIRIIGLGEGESTVLQVAEKIRLGESYEKVPNVWVKRKDGTVIKNSIGPLIDINKPLPDYSLFDESRFHRPMGGKVYKTLPLETYRGCPYLCTFCNSPMQQRFARVNDLSSFLRRKRMERVREEIIYLLGKHNPEYFYIIDDSFLARPFEEIEAFCKMYSEFKLPFWFNTRPETVTAELLDMLRDVNCHRMSIGLEHGNQEFRKKVLKRLSSNEQMLNAFTLIANGGIAYSINNIIGFPTETRELLFETIEFNRLLAGYDTLTVSIFTPYHGTELRETAVKLGYLKHDTLTTHTTSSSLLNMPQLNSEEIDGLMRTFPLYVQFPKELWKNIEIAEKMTDEGEMMFQKLSEAYQKLFLAGDQETRKPDWEEVFGFMSKTQMR